MQVGKRDGDNNIEGRGQKEMIIVQMTWWAEDSHPQKLYHRWFREHRR